MIISLDTETNGLDLIHGAMPYLVTTCDDEGVIRFWEWDVDPVTRRPEIPDSNNPGDYNWYAWNKDVSAITELINSADLIYMQNSQFDVMALHTIGIEIPWNKVRDTFCMGHLLASNHKHNLTDMVWEYLQVDIEHYELSIKEVTQACRAIVKKQYPHWKIAKEGAEGMPSVSESSDRKEDKAWKADMWLPRALAKVKGNVNLFRLSPDSTHPNNNWLTACSRYANADSEHTLPLGLEMERRIRDAGLWAIYEHRLHLPRIAYEMKSYGVTAVGEYTDRTISDYEEYVAEAACELVAIAAEYGHDLELAKGAALNDNMREFFYGTYTKRCPSCSYSKCVKHWNDESGDDLVICVKCANRKRNPKRHNLLVTRRDNLNLPVVKGKKSENASLDKDVMQEYLTTLDQGPALDFIRILTDKRKHDTDLGYMEAYRRFWLPVKGSEGFHRIHTSLNPFGTDHLRWANNSPNLQNVGKQEDESRTSVRNCFGPAPGREWWSMDFQNIELRIPAYESGEEAMIELFERPNEPPYFGSYHCLNASIIYPDLFNPLANTEGAFKKKYKSTEYQWCKNGGFALQYGCGERKADNTFRRKGAYRLLKQKLPKVAALNDYYVQQANKTGYVTTLPDRTVDANKGYPILAKLTDDGRILSTTPFNYHVSGTACWCKNQAAIRCSDQLAKWRSEGFDAHMSLEIHDELLFDFPRGNTPEENLPRAKVLQKLMAKSGEDLIPRIPTPVSIELHLETWAKGVTM